MTRAKFPFRRQKKFISSTSRHSESTHNLFSKSHSIIIIKNSSFFFTASNLPEVRLYSNVDSKFKFLHKFQFIKQQNDSSFPRALLSLSSSLCFSYLSLSFNKSTPKHHNIFNVRVHHVNRKRNSYSTIT